MFNRVRHYAKLILKPEYRREYCELAKLKKMPRFTPGVTRILGRELQMLDAASVFYMYKDIFQKGIYQFETKNSAPVIIDGGANVGMSVIYFKMLYPNSIVTAFEPDRRLFEILKSNIQTFSLKKVALVSKALWDCKTELEFMSEGADAGRLDERQNEFSTIRVPTVRLNDYLHQDVDFLKLDIEGAETRVLVDCQEHLHRVRHLFVEYHSFENQPQTLDIILSILQNAGFRYQIQHISMNRQPFMHRYKNLGMDMQLNVFAYRDV